MTYTITGTATYASQANRDAARTRVDTAMSGYGVGNATTVFSAGINNPTTTTMTVSVQILTEDPALASEIQKAIYDAWTLTNRNTSGYLSVSKT